MKRDKRTKKQKEKADKKAADHTALQKIIKSVLWAGSCPDELSDRSPGASGKP